MLELVSFLEMHIICILISNALIFQRCSFHSDVVKESRGCNSPPSDGRLCQQPYLLSQSSCCLSLISQRRAAVVHVGRAFHCSTFCPATVVLCTSDFAHVGNRLML